MLSPPSTIARTWSAHSASAEMLVGQFSKLSFVYRLRLWGGWTSYVLAPSRNGTTAGVANDFSMLCPATMKAENSRANDRLTRQRRRFAKPDRRRTLELLWRNARKRSVNVFSGKLWRNPTTGTAGCCARAESGHAAAPPSSVMNSRLSHSITSSAVASNDGGTVRPRAFAVLTLNTNSYLVGCWTGRSAGFSPLRIRSTYPAARRYWSMVSGP